MNRGIVLTTFCIDYTHLYHDSKSPSSLGLTSRNERRLRVSVQSKEIRTGHLGERVRFTLIMIFIPSSSIAQLLFISTVPLFASVQAQHYGVDISFPIHSDEIMLDGNPLGDRQALYDDFIQGCMEFYGEKGQVCLQVKADRIAMSVRQPQSMVNYTDTGFKKMQAPKGLMDLLNDFWSRNKEKKQLEKWYTGSTYVNSWQSPTYMVSVENSSLRGGGSILKERIWDAAKETIQHWTAQEIVPCSMYGIRTYTNGAILAPHVDRLPLVSSAIVNVAQDVNEPWPLEVYGRDGKAYNVTMEPGDMILYESHSLIHGRPFPLKGRYYANIFIHFEPIGHSETAFPDHLFQYDVDQLYRNSKKKQAGHENNQLILPSYIISGSAEETNRRQRSPATYKNHLKAPYHPEKGDVHEAAQTGNLNKLREVAKRDKELLHSKDENGWQPIHEGARAGYEEVVKLWSSMAQISTLELIKGVVALYYI